MVAPIRQIVTVQPGGLVEVRSDLLLPGTRAEVTVTVVPEPKEPKLPLSSFIGRGKGVFKNATEVDEYIREERDWGDRDPER